MTTSIIKDKNQIAQYLLKFPHLNYYHLGDLDDFFWPHTKWFANQTNGDIDAICLLYSGLEPPVLLAIENENKEKMEELIINILPSLPDKFYSHLSPGLEKLFQSSCKMEHHGKHFKMYLDDSSKLPDTDEEGLLELRKNDLVEVLEFYEKAYPNNWFDPRMLETNQYLGIRNENKKIISVGGVHVYSEEYNIAALGNIATLPDFRYTAPG